MLLKKIIYHLFWKKTRDTSMYITKELSSFSTICKQDHEIGNWSDIFPNVQNLCVFWHWQYTIITRTLFPYTTYEAWYVSWDCMPVMLVGTRQILSILSASFQPIEWRTESWVWDCFWDSNAGWMASQAQFILVHNYWYPVAIRNTDNPSWSWG